MSQFEGLWWLLILLGPLLFFQRRLHIEIQAVLLLVTRRVDLTTTIFAIIFFPGVLIHELSHYFMASALRVRTGRLSLLPRSMGNGKLQMGYLETAKVDILRESLIGVAPLLAGIVVVAYVGIVHWQLPVWWSSLVSDPRQDALAATGQLVSRPDFWIWFYLVLAISSTMIPSRSDRRAWLPLLIVAVILVGLSIFAGAGPWMLANFAPFLNTVFSVVAIVFAVSLGVHLFLWPPIYLVRRMLSRITGYQVA